MLMPNLLRARCCGAFIFGVEVVRPVLVMLELCAAATSSTSANLSEVFLLVEVGVLVVLVPSF